MTERKRLFRRVFDSMVESRSQAAQRYIAEYLRVRRALENESRE